MDVHEVLMVIRPVIGAVEAELINTSIQQSAVKALQSDRGNGGGGGQERQEKRPGSQPSQGSTSFKWVPGGGGNRCRSAICLPGLTVELKSFFHVRVVATRSPHGDYQVTHLSI